MRIAYDHQIFTQQQFGGISRYFAELVPRLVALGESPLIFAGLHRNEYLNTLSPGMVRGRFTPGIHGRLQRLRFRVNEAYMKRGMAQWKPDVIHETYYRSSVSGPKGTPVVVTVHDMVHELFPEEFPNQKVESDAKRKAVELAAHVICISRNTRDDLIRIFGVEPDKISVVHHGYEGIGSNCTAASSSKRMYFLFVGHRGGYKNFRRLIEAAAGSGIQRDFDILAFGGNRFSPEELKHLRALGYRDNQVRQIAGSDSLLASLYRGAHALVYPSIYEGFGLPPLEAMAQGCPVISSNTSSMPEVIGDAAEFFDPLDVEDMSRALSRIAFSDSRRSELIAMGLERIKQFSWDKTAAETRGVYQKILK